MTDYHEEYVDVRGAHTRVVHAGTGSSTIMFIHGGMAGITPICCGSHLWTRTMPLFAQQDASIVAFDFPGHGGSSLPTGLQPTIEQQSHHVIALLERGKDGAAHLIGHGEGGLVALNVAIDRPDLVRSIVVAASGAAAPSGDLPENPTLASPPLPLWSRESQFWALNRLSPFREPDNSILDACVVASKGDPHREAAKLAADSLYSTRIRADLLSAKARLFATCRDSRIPVPVQLIWGSHDPLASVEQGLVLYRIIAATQPASNFHVLAGAGHFVFNDRTQTFHSIVTAFHSALGNGCWGAKPESVD
jgi:pimeloyl-ACP methyl ester carboxylesterase